MSVLKELFQDADWKSEKHVPVLDIPSEIMKGEFFTARLSVGKEILHPNTTAHHIVWGEIAISNLRVRSAHIRLGT